MVTPQHAALQALMCLLAAAEGGGDPLQAWQRMQRAGDKVGERSDGTADESPTHFEADRPGQKEDIWPG